MMPKNTVGIFRSIGIHRNLKSISNLCFLHLYLQLPYILHEYRRNKLLKSLTFKKHLMLQEI